MLGTWWQERTGRERWTLIAGASAVGVVALYLLVEPQIQERRRLAAELPQLRQDLAWMRQRVDAASRLNAGARKQNPDRESEVTPALVQEAVRASDLQDQLAELGTAGGGVRLSFEQVAFAQLVSLMQDVKRRANARVVAANIQRLPDESGMVRAELTLRAGASS